MMDNFVNALADARSGCENSIIDILGMFENKIKVLSQGDEDLKSELTLEVLEQIIGKRSSTFSVSRLTNHFKWSGSSPLGKDSYTVRDKYIQKKFTLWINLHLSWLAMKLTGKSKVTVYIPWYVATATRHYNKLLNHFGTHKEVVSFVEGEIKQEAMPKDIVRSKEILSNNLRTKGRKNLLERVRLLVSEIPFNSEVHSVIFRPEQEFRMMTKEFILDRPCNTEVRDKVGQAAGYRLEGKIGLSTERGLVGRCSRQLTRLNNYKCEKSKCASHDKCCSEWKELEKEIA